MSDILNNFRIFSKINKSLKQKITVFHVFKDGNNVLFVTNEDKVFGSGENTGGYCGLGHNSVVNEPQVIPELCHKNIRQFFIGCDFVLALSCDKQLYGWGRNDHGQLGRGNVSDWDQYFKPGIIDFLSESIIQVSCGASHTLALTLEGNVYGWGYNKFGQIGCGTDVDVVKPILLEVFPSYSIKSIYCSDFGSIALTTEGMAYSWGYTGDYSLGHEIQENVNVFKPKQINISNVLSIGSSVYNTYFLTTDGLIYFCGQYFNQDKKRLFELTPKLLNSRTKFTSLQPNYCAGIASAVSQESIIKIDGKNIIPTNYRNYFEFYSSDYKITFKTIEINQEHLFDGNDLTDLQCYIRFDFRFEDMFENGVLLGTGGFGSVFKVQRKFNNKIFAIKKIMVQGMTETTNEELMREVNTLSKCSDEYVVQYFDSWIQNNNCLYIQMEFCSHNLREIIEQKRHYFGRQEKEEMKTIEFFISCQLFKELLECVQYLHESNPPIIHRDLKPENILICENQNNGRYLKIGDFGTAKLQTLSVLSHTRFVGTQNYMSPEVQFGTTYNTKSDIHSLSVILKEMFDFNIYSSEPVIGNEYLKSNWPILKNVILSMMNIQYNERPSCAQILSKITEWSISLDQLIASDFNYCQVFKEDTFIHKYYNMQVLNVLFPGHFLKGARSVEQLKNFNITFVVNNQEINCNKQLLMLKNHEFKLFFKNTNSTKIIIMVGLNYQAFRIMIHYLYFNEFIQDDNNQDHLLLIEIYKCAEKYKIIPMIEKTKRLISALIRIVKIKDIYQFAKTYHLEDIINLTRVFIKENFEAINKLNVDKIKELNALTDNYLIELYFNDRVNLMNQLQNR